MAGRQSPGATCLSNVRRGVSGHLFSLPTYTASEPRTWRQDAMALRLHVVAIPRDDQGTLLNISHNTFVESKFLVRSRKFTQNPPHWRSRLSTLGEHWCHMTWSRLLGGTWVLIWWIWELTESTQQNLFPNATVYCAWYCQMLQVNQLYQLLYIPLVQACHADKKHTRTALVAVDFGQLSNTKMEAQRTRSWRGLLPSADTSK